jgi:hypothetical protein
MTVNQTRSLLYSLARFLGDVDTIRHPHRIPKRVANKLIGRNVVPRKFLALACGACSVTNRPGKSTF